MSTEESAFGQETLAYYGNPLESYCGKGSLTLEDERKADCAFAAGQLRNGKVVLLCALPSSFDFGTLDLRVPAKRFEGTTAEGFRIWAEDLFEINYLPDPPANATGTWAAFRVRKMSVNVSKVDLAQTAHFGLTNFDFIGSEWRSNGDSWYKVLPFSLQCGENTIELAVVPVTGHHRALNRLRTLKGIDVTCEVTAPIPEGGGTERNKDPMGLLLRIQCRRDTSVTDALFENYEPVLLLENPISRGR